MEEDWVFAYDRTWEGMLTAVFDAFSRRCFPVAFIGEEEVPPLFASVHTVLTDGERAGRVFRALQKKRADLLNPKSKQRTKRQKIQDLVKQAQKSGLKPDEIASRLGLPTEE